jgi:hypothetical protein
MMLSYNSSVVVRWKSNHGGSPFRISTTNKQPLSTSDDNSRNTWTNYPLVYENSKYGTVIGLGADYDLPTYQRFVGSLRKTAGYRGNIILGMQQQQLQRQRQGPKAHEKQEILSYLVQHNVTIQNIHVQQDCHDDDVVSLLAEGVVCLDDPLSKHGWKLSWRNYFLVRQWLKECTVCNAGPILLVSIPDTTFLQSPFDLHHNNKDNDDNDNDADVNAQDNQIRLELYETPLSTDNWRLAMFLKTCKGFNWDDVPLISSQVIKGDRMSILFYLEAMLEEMRHWKESTTTTTKDCHFNLHGDDLSIHNYLYYNGNILAQVHSASNRQHHDVTFVTQENEYEDLLERDDQGKGRWIVRLLNEPDGDGGIHSPLHALAPGYFTREDYNVLSNWTRKNHQHG